MVFIYRQGINFRPVRYGGTGSESHLDRQPEVLPDRYEAGPLNGPGIAGLRAGVSVVLEEDVRTIRKKEKKLLEYIFDRMESMDNIIIYGPRDAEKQVGVISFSVQKMRAEEVVYALDRECGIMVRAGLHCSPLSHRVMGTVRMSFGYFNGKQDADDLLDGLKRISHLSR